ncbi:hypothetical protein, partial [Cetobacterium sp.]|uniref:hypothetical protein n=1 Tax=Cetobacterium sp. TaxID=2071632 RepID=UPI003EE67779
KTIYQNKFSPKVDLNSDDFKSLKKTLENHSKRLETFFSEVSTGNCKYEEFSEKEKEKFLKKFYLLVEYGESYLKNGKNNNKLLSNLSVYKNDNVKLELFEFDLFKNHFNYERNNFKDYEIEMVKLKEDIGWKKYYIRTLYLKDQEIESDVDTTRLIIPKLEKAQSILKELYLNYNSTKNMNLMESIKKNSYFLDFATDITLQFLIKVLINDKILRKVKKLSILNKIKNSLIALENMAEDSFINNEKDIFKSFFLLITHANIIEFNSKYEEVIDEISSQIDLEKSRIPEIYMSKRRWVSHLEENQLIEELTLGQKERTSYYKKNKRQFIENKKLTKDIMKHLPEIGREFSANYLQHFRGVFRELYENKNTIKENSFRAIAKKFKKDKTYFLKVLDTKENILFREVLSKAMFIECDQLEEYILKNEIQSLLSKIELKIYNYYDSSLTLDKIFQKYSVVLNIIKEACEEEIAPLEEVYSLSDKEQFSRCVGNRCSYIEFLKNKYIYTRDDVRLLKNLYKWRMSSNSYGIYFSSLKYEEEVLNLTRNLYDTFILEDLEIWKIEETALFKAASLAYKELLEENLTLNINILQDKIIQKFKNYQKDNKVTIANSLHRNNISIDILQGDYIKKMDLTCNNIINCILYQDKELLQDIFKESAKHEYGITIRDITHKVVNRSRNLPIFQNYLLRMVSTGVSAYLAGTNDSGLADLKLETIDNNLYKNRNLFSSLFFDLSNYSIDS